MAPAMPSNEEQLALLSLSPVDGRYAGITAPLRDYFSEHALIKRRVQVEIAYFASLCAFDIAALKGVKQTWLAAFKKVGDAFSLADSVQIKSIERKIQHDVKAIEYFLREKLREITQGNTPYEAFIHFGLTSQDINNTAIPLLLRDAQQHVMLPALHTLVGVLEKKTENWQDIVMLAHTHGQAASPTCLGKEMRVFEVRIKEQLQLLSSIPFAAKFGGAVGNLNAHKLSYPEKDWHAFANNFVHTLGLKRSHPTTQIEHYDHLAALLDNWKRINNILIDLCQDMWLYIAMDYLTLEVVAEEVGSSCMPQKINPIRFENAEGNLCMANAIFNFMASKLPISRLQRDLTDSTVLRNIGLPFAHTLLAIKNIQKGLQAVKANKMTINKDLAENQKVLAEGIQILLKKHGYTEAYEAIKGLVRTHENSLETMWDFIDGLDLPASLKKKLRTLSVKKYTGYCE